MLAVMLTVLFENILEITDLINKTANTLLPAVST